MHVKWHISYQCGDMSQSFQYARPVHACMRALAESTREREGGRGIERERERERERAVVASAVQVDYSCELVFILRILGPCLFAHLGSLWEDNIHRPGLDFIWSGIRKIARDWSWTWLPERCWWDYGEWCGGHDVKRCGQRFKMELKACESSYISTVRVTYI